MAKNLLVSLVQSGVSVRMDVKPVAERLGTKFQAMGQPPLVNVYPCLVFPTRLEEIDPNRRPNHANYARMGQAASGAGRSLGFAGSRSAARSAARTVLSREARKTLRSQPMTAKASGLRACGSVSLGSGALERSATSWASPATWAAATR